MRLSIHAVGRLKQGPEAELCRRYVDRLSRAGPAIGLEFGGLQEIAESRASTAAMRRAEESEKLNALVQRGFVLVLLDETGENPGSAAFAGKIGSLRDEGVRDCVFAIGGPDGHDSALIPSARLVLSFGKLTWPHQIARIMLAEQLYRAMTILSGHPYHRD